MYSIEGMYGVLIQEQKSSMVVDEAGILSGSLSSVSRIELPHRVSGTLSRR